MSIYPKNTNARRLALGLLPIALMAAPFAQAEEKADETVPSPNYVEFGVTGTDVNGSEAAYRARTNYSSDFMGGIERMHYERQLDKGWFFEMDARSIFDESEYNVKAVFEKEGFNRTVIGFENHRYWSDARTVDIPGDPLFEPFDPSLHLDRSKFFVESTFYPSDVFDLTFRYTYRERDGEKASTMWGDSSGGFSGLKTVPSFWDIDETSHKFELEAERRWEQTTLNGAVSWDHREADNSYNYVRGYNGTTGAYWTQTDERENDTFATHGVLERRVNEKLLLNMSAMYSQLDGEAAGDKIKGDFYGAPYDNAELSGRDHGFIDLDANYDVDQYVASFGALYQPSQNWFVTPSVRFETMSRDGKATEVATGAGGAEHDLVARNSDDYDTLAAELGVRYTGVTNWTFYGDAFASHGEGDLMAMQYDITTPASLDVDRDYDYERDQYKLTAGANWNALSNVTVSFQTYYQVKENDYDHKTLEAGDNNRALISEQEFETFNFNTRVNWRIRPNLTSISRFDYQLGTIGTKSYFGELVGNGSFESADREYFSYSQGLTYQATQRLTLMGSFNYVQDRLSTPASSYNNPGEVAETQNDYIYGDLTAFYAHSDTLNFTGTVSQLVSDNAGNDFLSVPYGADFEEFRVSLSATKRLAANKSVTIGYGYYDYEDDTLSGEGDFESHIVTAKYEYRF